MFNQTILPSTATVVTVNSEEVEMEPGDPFLEAVRDCALDAGYSKFRVFITRNGVEEEIRGPEEAPAMITEGMKLRITPYEKAA